MDNTIFCDSQNLRNKIIKSGIRYQKKPIPMSVAYFWPTKYCPIGCEHCMFASPGLSKIDHKYILSQEAVSNFIKISKTANLDSLIVSGGGEPTLEMDTILRLINESEYKYFELITGAHWTVDEQLIHEYLGKIQTAISKRKKRGSKFHFSLRVSIDSFHQKVVKLESLGKLVLILMEDYYKEIEDKKYPDISLFFRTLLVEGDNTADSFASYLGGTISEIKNYVRTIKLGNVLNPYELIVFYKDMRFVGKATNIGSVKKSVKFDKFFDSYSKESGDVRLGMTYLNPGSKGEALDGINVFVSYDGRMLPYGGVPDLVLDINKDSNYSKYVRRLMGDIVSRTLLFKGLRHIEDIAKEIEPKISKMIEQKNWLASVADMSLSTPEMRLYVTIRLLQNEIANGEIQIDSLPDWLQKLTTISAKKLRDKYRELVLKSPKQMHEYINENVTILS